jgi:tetratricopeptide (TPR) repeat protein
MVKRVRIACGCLLLVFLCANGCATRRAETRTGGAGGIPVLSQKEIEVRAAALAHFATAVSQDIRNQPEAALESYLASMRLDPSNDTLAVNLARRFLGANKSEAAAEVLRLATEKQPENGSLQAWLGLALARAGRTNEAVAANLSAIQLVPDRFPPYQNLIQLHLQAGETNKALRMAKKAEGVKTSDAEFQISLAEQLLKLEKAAALARPEAESRVAVALDKAWRETPTHPLLLQRIADAHLAHNRSAPAALALRKVLDQYPQFPGVRERLATLYLRSDKKEEALAMLEEIQAKNPGDPKTYLFLGSLAHDLKEFEKAGEYYERALNLQPDFEPLYYDLAATLLMREQAGEALRILGKARARFKMGFLMEFYSGIAHAAKGEFEAAVNSYTSAEVLARNSDASRLNHLFYFQMGSAQERLGRHEDAARSLRLCLNLNPEFPDALNYLGYMWAERGENLEEALAMIRKAVEKEPESPAYLDSLAWVLHKLGRSAEALPWMEKAIQLAKTPDATLFDHLGDIQAALGNQLAAREAWEKSLGLEPSPVLREKLRKLGSR